MREEVASIGARSKGSSGSRRGGVDGGGCHHPIGPQRGDPLIRPRSVRVEHEVGHEVERERPRERSSGTVDGDRSEDGHGDGASVAGSFRYLGCRSHAHNGRPIGAR